MIQNKIYMRYFVTCVIYLFLCFIITPVALADNTRVTYLDQQIQNTNNTKEKAKYFAYRARIHNKTNNTSSAEQDYLSALKNNNAGWIWAELAQFYAKHKYFDKSEIAIAKIERDFPHLKTYIVPLSKHVKEQQRIIHLKENPPEIILNADVNPARKSRFDVAREQQRYSYVKQESSAIYASCKQKWGDDYRMVEYCTKKQQDARKVVKSHRGGIRARCEEKWGDDYRMVEYCINKQTTAKRNLSKAYPSQENKRISCERKWGKDYRMVEYCMKH